MPKLINLFEYVKYSLESSNELRTIRDKKKFSDDLETVLD